VVLLVNTKHRHGFWHPTDLLQALPQAGSVPEAFCNWRAETRLADITAASTPANHIFLIIVGSFFIFCIAVRVVVLQAGKRPWSVH